jgi:hypothetical protein
MLGTASGFYSLQAFPPQITSEACPAGKWEVHHIERTTLTADDTLAHSEAYSDPQALGIVIRWLGGTTTDARRDRKRTAETEQTH